MNTPVDFSTAKLLKEKGFDKPCYGGRYYNNGKEHVRRASKYVSISDSYVVLSPTIAEVIMWLYEKHGIGIIPSYKLNIENHKKEWFWIAIEDGEEIVYQYKDFSSPTEAYEAAIEYTLKNLI